MCAHDGLQSEEAVRSCFLRHKICSHLVPMSQNVSASFFYSWLCVMSVRVDIHHMVISGRAGVVAVIATVEMCLQEMSKIQNKTIILRPHRLAVKHKSY